MSHPRRSVPVLEDLIESVSPSFPGPETKAGSTRGQAAPPEEGRASMRARAALHRRRGARLELIPIPAAPLPLARDGPPTRCSEGVDFSSWGGTCRRCLLLRRSDGQLSPVTPEERPLYPGLQTITWIHPPDPPANYTSENSNGL